MCFLKNNTEALEITDKTLFLLGNGCSREYEFPEGKELLLKSFQLIKKYKGSDNETHNSFANNLYQELNSLLLMLDMLRDKILLPYTPADLDSVAYSRLLEAADYPEMCSNGNEKICKECLDHKKRKFMLYKCVEKCTCCIKLREELKKMYVWDLFGELVTKCDGKPSVWGDPKWKKISITDAYDDFAILLTKTLFYCYINRRNSEAYCNFVKNLKSFSGTVLSLNYDLLLEDEIKNKSFNLIKPHGSFDLIYSKDPDKDWDVEIVRTNIYRLKTKKLIREFGYGRYSIFFHKPLNIAYADIETHKSAEGTNQVKFVREYTIHEVERLKNIIPNSDKVIAIGYSFSENYNKNGLIDKHIIEPLLSKKIYVVGKGNTKDIVDRVKRYYKKAHILHTDFNGFGDYARQIKFHE